MNRDQIQSFRGGLLVLRHHRGDRVAHVAHVLGRERIFVLGHRQDAEAHREVLAGEHQVNTRVFLRSFHVDGLDEGVRVRRAQQAHVQHARQDDVVGEARLAGDLGAAVDAAARLADDLHVSRSMVLAAASMAS